MYCVCNPGIDQYVHQFHLSILLVSLHWAAEEFHFLRFCLVNLFVSDTSSASLEFQETLRSMYVCDLEKDLDVEGG